MTSTGEILRAERERRGLSLDDLSATTKIQKRHLRAIELSEYDDLPGEVFAKGYVKSYAEALGLDSARIAAEFTRERRGGDAGEAQGDVGRRTGSTRAAFARLAELGPPAGSPSRARLMLLAAALLVTLVVAVGYVLWPDDDGDAATRPAPVAAVAPDEAGAAAAPGGHGDEAATTGRTSGAVEDGGGVTPPGGEADNGGATGPSTAGRRDGSGGTGDDAAATRDSETTSREPDASDGTKPATDRAAAAPVAIAPTPTAAPPPVESRPAADDRATPRPTAPAPTTAPPVTTAPPRLAVPEFGAGTGVRNLQLVGRGDVFREGQDVSFWTRVVGGSRGDAVRHVWIHEGRQVASIRLRIGGSHWRTHSTKRLVAGSAGDWAIEARDGEGRVLARSTFSCLPGRAPGP